MLRELLALAALCAMASVPLALAGEGDSTLAPNPELPAASVCNADLSHSQIRASLANRRWRVKHPLRRVLVCPNQKHYLAKQLERFRMYRRYRQVAPYRGLSEGDPWLKWLAVPAYVVACETRGYWGHGRWRARNPSGAIGPYQFLDWPVPWPVDSVRDKLAHHRMAASLGLSNWSCA